jgi:hypothetical protein
MRQGERKRKGSEVRNGVLLPIRNQKKLSAVSAGPAGKIRAAWRRISSGEKREEGGELGL